MENEGNYKRKILKIEYISKSREEGEMNECGYAQLLQTSEFRGSVGCLVVV